MTTSQPERLTDEQLTAIENRAAHLAEYASQNDGEGDTLAGVDVPALVAEIRLLRAQLDAEKQAHLFTLRQRNNRSTRLTHLRDLALAGDTEALAEAAKDTLAASRGDHDACHTPPVS